MADIVRQVEEMKKEEAFKQKLVAIRKGTGY